MRNTIKDGDPTVCVNIPCVACSPLVIFGQRLPRAVGISKISRADGERCAPQPGYRSAANRAVMSKPEQAECWIMAMPDSSGMAVGLFQIDANGIEEAQHMGRERLTDAQCPSRATSSISAHATAAYSRTSSERCAARGARYRFAHLRNASSSARRRAARVDEQCALHVELFVPSLARSRPACFPRCAVARVGPSDRSRADHTSCGFRRLWAVAPCITSVSATARCEACGISRTMPMLVATEHFVRLPDVLLSQPTHWRQRADCHATASPVPVRHRRVRLPCSSKGQVRGIRLSLDRLSDRVRSLLSLRSNPCIE